MRANSVFFKSVLTGVICLFGAYFLWAQDQKPQQKSQKKKTKDGASGRTGTYRFGKVAP